ncbi:MAG: hypothetical protein WBD36_15960 [Bacteroidota bacterium]
MHIRTFVIPFCLLCNYGLAQVSVVSIEKLLVGSSQAWSHPQFSPDGASVFFTTQTLQGIWRYSLRDSNVALITSDAGAGNSFSFSGDGKQIAYRRTTYARGSRQRKQEIVLKNLAGNRSFVIASAASLSNPTFQDKQVVYSVGPNVKNLKPMKGVNDITILGIEDTKIALNMNGKKTLLDPFGKGSYIWPSLSPDKQSVLAYEMSRGTFISTVKGKIQTTLGRRNAPVWTRDGRWIVFMDDKDDGHRIVTSDLYCISPDGSKTVQLTNTPDVIELYPHCSPVENRIVCASAVGEIFMITYQSVGE